jgi:hypothetical protein
MYEMRSILSSTGVVIVGLLVAGCGSAPSVPLVQSEPLAWVRTDGQSGRANPALVDQFATDRAACGIAANADNAALRAAEACMSTRGYVLVPARQADATAAQFRASQSYATPN